MNIALGRLNAVHALVAIHTAKATPWRLLKLLFRITIGVAPNPISYRQKDRELGAKIFCQQFFCIFEEFFHFHSLGHLIR